MKSEIKYENLNKEQRKFICNGCGGKGMLIPVPNFIFKARCNVHDVKHYIGHTEEHRVEQNDDFYMYMKEDIADIVFYEEDMNWWKKSLSMARVSIRKSHYHIWAFTYYQAVKIGSERFFHYADGPRTMEDLKLEMMRAGV